MLHNGEKKVIWLSLKKVGPQKTILIWISFHVSQQKVLAQVHHLLWNTGHQKD